MVLLYIGMYKQEKLYIYYLLYFYLHFYIFNVLFITS